MRKNGVNRELREILGGVCAPEGFKAGGVACGIKQDGGEDLALIVADKRCAAACVFSADGAQSATATVSKNHLKYGFARAIIANSGIANLFHPTGEWLAETVCRTLAKHSDMDANEAIIASTGKINAALTLRPFEEGIPLLYKALRADSEGSLLAAKAIMTTDSYPKQVSYEFDLGDFPCKIGAVFKGNTRVCPNMATTLVFLTTDVNISPEMLQKSLSSAVKDTVNMLWLDGISSPNDTVCVLANGKAGNYKISRADSEYAKFAYALRKTLTEICKKFLLDGEHIRFFTKVTGAKSKQTAREIAKRLAGAQAIKEGLLHGYLDGESVLYIAHSVAGETDASAVSIFVENTAGKLVVFEGGRPLLVNAEHFERLTQETELTLRVDLGIGNYSAQAFGII